jgi:Integrase core domain
MWCLVLDYPHECRGQERSTDWHKQRGGGFPLRCYGTQFTSSRFLETLGRLGITHRRTAYHHLEGNSYIERFHRSLKEEEVWAAEYRSLEEARASIARWIEEYIHDRPRRGVENRTPHEAFLAFAVLTKKRGPERLNWRGALHYSPISWTREDLISNLESSDLFPDLDDFTCAIMSQNKKESIGPQKTQFTIAQLEINWVHTCSMNSHQNVIGARLR